MKRILILSLSLICMSYLFGQDAPSTGNAVTLNGTNQFLLSSEGKTPINPRSFTMETWIKFNNPGSGNASNAQNDWICETGNSSAMNTWFWFNNSNLWEYGYRKIHVGFWGASGGALGGGDFTYDFNPISGTWYHLAFTYNSSTKKVNVYINGVSKGEKTNTGTDAPIQVSNMKLTLGKRIFGGVESHHLDGSLDEFRFWSVARTASEIATNYQKELTGKEIGLQAYYKFDELLPNTAALFNDCSAQAYHISGVNTPKTVVSTAPLTTNVACGILPTCDPPATTVTNTTLISVNINWASAVGTYEVQYRIQGSTTWLRKTATSTVTTPVTFLTLSNLVANKTYEYQIRLKCTATNISPYSALQQFTTKSCDNATITVKANITTAQFAWQAVSGVLSYQIQYRVKGTSNWTTGMASSPATTLNVKNLTPNALYEYQFRVQCSATTYSSYSSIRTFSPQCSPTNFTHTTLIKGGVTLIWQIQPDVYGYEISYRKVTHPQSNFETKTFVGATNNTTTFTALSIGDFYEFKMRTKCSSTVNSDYISSIFVTIPASDPNTDGSNLISTNNHLTQNSAHLQGPENSMLVSPNPTNGLTTLQINSLSKGTGQIILSDYLGRIVLKTTDIALDEGVQTHEIDLSPFNNGVYFIRLIKGDFQTMEKVLLNK